MVVDSGPSVAENCSCQLFRHFPHLAHVLAINELVEFGISLVVKYVRYGSVVSLTPPGLVLM
jgi:hypothetical protein